MFVMIVMTIVLFKDLMKYNFQQFVALSDQN